MSKKSKEMTRKQAAKAYDRIADELDRLMGAASNHISRRDNNWVFERVYSFRHIAERIRLKYDVGEYVGGGAHAERLGSEEREELKRLRQQEHAKHTSANTVLEQIQKTGEDMGAAIEAEIQEAFASEPEPAPDDLEGWKRRAGSWQAAWAGAHKRAAQKGRS